MSQLPIIKNTKTFYWHFSIFQLTGSVFHLLTSDIPPIIFKTINTLQNTSHIHAKKTNTRNFVVAFFTDKLPLLDSPRWQSWTNPRCPWLLKFILKKSPSAGVDADRIPPSDECRLSVFRHRNVLVLKISNIRRGIHELAAKFPIEDDSECYSQFVFARKLKNFLR